MPTTPNPTGFSRQQQFKAWGLLFEMLHEDRLGHHIDCRHGLEIAEALVPSWSSFDQTLKCIAQRMRDLDAARSRV